MAHVSRFNDTWARLAPLCCFGVICASPRVAHAGDEERGSATARSGFTFDLGLSVGGATAEFTESDHLVADFEALAVGVGARWGWFVARHLLLGAEVAASWHSAGGTLRVKDRSYFSTEGLPTEASYEVVAPLGAFIALYPSERAGLFVGLSGGLGFLGLPGFAEGATGFMSGYSMEAGYELSGSAKRGAALFLRYSRWAGEESPISSEHPDGLVSRELLLGARFSFWTPEWR